MKRFIILLLLILLLSGCSNEQKVNTTVAVPDDYPDQESWNTFLVITREGKTIGNLKAGYVQKYSKKNITLLSDSISVDFYNDKGQHTSLLTAKGGKVFDSSQDMLAFGNVVVVSDSGVTLYGDTLRWDNKNQKIYSDIPVKLTTREHDTLYGDRFISDRHLNDYEIINPRGKSSKSIKIE